MAERERTSVEWAERTPERWLERMSGVWATVTSVASGLAMVTRTTMATTPANFTSPITGTRNPTATDTAREP